MKSCTIPTSNLAKGSHSTLIGLCQGTSANAVVKSSVGIVREIILRGCHCHVAHAISCGHSRRSPVRHPPARPPLLCYSHQGSYGFCFFSPERKERVRIIHSTFPLLELFLGTHLHSIDFSSLEASTCILFHYHTTVATPRLGPPPWSELTFQFAIAPPQTSRLPPRCLWSSITMNYL